MNNTGIIKLNRKFGYVVAGALLFITAFQYVFKDKQDVIIFCIALILLLLALIKPVWLTPLRIAWDKIGHVLGYINTAEPVDAAVWQGYFKTETPDRSKHLLGNAAGNKRKQNGEPILIR